MALADNPKIREAWNQLRLRDDSAEIERLHPEILETYRTTLPKVIRIGEILTRQKKRLGHGRFGLWLATLPFSGRTARRHMRCFTNRDKLLAESKTDTMSDLVGMGVTEAYRTLSKPASKRRSTHKKRQEADPTPPGFPVQVEGDRNEFNKMITKIGEWTPELTAKCIPYWCVEQIYKEKRDAKNHANGRTRRQ